LALDQNVSGFISLAGAGKTIDQILIEQISKTAPMFLNESKRVIAVLKAGKTTSDYPVALSSIFNLEVQAFMANWMQYDPVEEIRKQSVRSLIINGDKDLQVGIPEAELLYSAATKGELVVVKKMNHILVKIEGDDLENMKSYNQSEIELAEEVTDSILAFVISLN
jgi:fermentation-respiration switch protein FrsA (DUF1100 family)